MKRVCLALMMMLALLLCGCGYILVEDATPVQILAPTQAPGMEP